MVIADISSDALKAAKARLEQAGAHCWTLQWDLADLPLVQARIAEVAQAAGPVDILVNNTGGPPPSPAAGQPVATWEDAFRSMVLSVIAVTDQVLPSMRQRGWGRIITSASSGVVTPIPNLAVSNAMRSSLVGWSKTLAREVAPDGVTANIVVPGRIATDRIRYLDEAKAKREGRPVDQVMAESTASIPIQRYGTPDEYAAMVTFLASTQASYITGAIMRVDGGLIPSI